MRRNELNSSSQIIRNLAYNPSFESTNISSVIRTNYATNPSLETAGATTAVRSNIFTNPSAETASGTVNVRTNLALNPSFEGTSGTTSVRTNLLPNPSMETGSSTVTVRTNLCTNPSMETASGTVNVRTNLFPNPNFEAGITGWNSAGGNPATLAQDATTSFSGTKSLKVTWASAGTGLIETATSGANAAACSAGSVYTASTRVKMTSGASRNMFLYINWFTSTGTYITQTQGTTTASVSGSYITISSTGTAPASAAYISVGHNFGAVTTTDVFNVDALLVENSSAVGGYFDGTNQVQQRANLCGNPSFETGTVGWGSGPNQTIAASTVQKYIGTQSLSVTRANATAGSGYVTYNTGVNVVAGQTYTASSYVYGGSGTYLFWLADPSNAVNTGTKTSFNAPGNTWTRISFTFTASAAVQNMTLFLSDDSNATPTAGTVIYMDAVLIEQTSTVGTYFDGSTAATTSTGFAWTGTANASTSYQYDKDFTYLWSGTANASPSYQQTPRVATIGVNANGGSVAYQSSGYALFGTKSIASKVIANSTYNGLSYYAGALTVNSPYTFSAWVYMPSLYGQGLVAVANGGGLSGNITGSLVTTVGSWARLSVTFTPTTTASVSVYVVTQSGDTPPLGQVFYSDGWLLEQTNTVNLYFDGTVAASENLVKGVPATMQSLSTATTGVSYSGQTWTRATTPAGSGSSIVRQYVNLSDILNGETYTTSVTLANDQAFSQQVSLDWCDQAQTMFTLSPGEIRRVTVSASKAVYDTVYRFSDLQVTQSTTESRSILYKDWLIEKGTTTGEYYTGTGDFTYSWSGTANASTSLQKATGLTGYALTSTSSVYQSSVQKNVNGNSLAVVTKGVNGDGATANDITSVTAGASYTFSAWVKQTTSHPLTFALRWKDSGQTILSDSMVAVSATPGQWTRVSASVVAPTGVVYMQPLIRIYAAHTATTFFVDDALIERASGLDTYFDGSTAASGDFTYAWAGTAHASISYQQAPTISNWANRWFGNGGGYGSFYQAKGGLSGTYARKVWTSANNGATMDAGINLPPIAVSPNVPYTMSAWVRSSVAQYINFYMDWRDSTNTTISATQMATGTLLTANTWTRLSISATSPATAVSAYFVFGPYGQAVAMPYNSTLDFDNVLIEQTGVLQDYFDGVNPIQNLLTNPSFEADTSGWSLTAVQAGSGRTTAKSYSGAASLFLIANDNLGDCMAVLSTGFTTTPYATYTVSAYVYVPNGVVASDFRAGNRNLWAVSYDGVSQSTVASANIDFTKTNQWQRLSTTITIPAVTAGLSVRLYAPANPLGVYWDAVMVEKTNVLNPYYEGQGDYTYAWAGAANTTVSYQQAPGVAGVSYVPTLSMAYQSKTVGAGSGTKSIRITPTHATSGDSFAELAGMIGAYTFKPNTLYTISGTRTINAPQTNINSSTHFRVNIGGGADLTVNLLTSLTNTAGSQRLVGRFTTGAGTGVGFIRVYDGSFFGGGDVWWDDLILEEGATDGTYFDGTNTIQNLIPNPSFDTNTTGWSAPNGSTVATSTAQAWIGTQSALITLPATGSASYSGTGVTVALAANTTYTFSGYVYIPTGGASVLLSVQATNYVTAGSQPVTATGGWKRLSVTFTTTLAQNYALYFLNSAATTAGQQFYVDGVLLEKSQYLHTYYAGLGDFTYAWTGTANASSSEQRASLVADRQSVATSSATYQSSVRALSGTKSGAVRVKNDVFASGTLMYPVNEYFTSTSLAVSAYNTWSLWVWVPSGSGTVRLEDVTTGTIGNPNTTFDTWERISVTFMGASANTAHILRLRAATTMSAGTVFWWDNELVEQTSAPLTYFDGSTGTVGDFTHSWAGTANASVSRESATTVDSYVGSTSMAVVASGDWATTGSKSLRIIPTTSSTDSFASTTFALETGKTYTMSANVRLTAPQTGTLDSRARKIMVYHSNGYSGSNQPANVAGVNRVSVTFTVTDATKYQSVRLYNGASAGGGDVWWDDFMIVEGTYTGDYVDGTKPFSKWTGVAQKSTSLGYPQQFLDIAGKPAAELIGTTGDTGNILAPDPFAARTVYYVYENTAMTSSWATALYYARPNGGGAEGITFQSNASGIDQLIPRADFIGGTQNAAPGLSGARGSRRHVIAVSIPQGLASSKWMLNGGADINLTYANPANGWASGRLYAVTNTNMAHIRSFVFYAEHDQATRLAMSRYLGNKYGALVS